MWYFTRVDTIYRPFQPCGCLLHVFEVVGIQSPADKTTPVNRTICCNVNFPIRRAGGGGCGSSKSALECFTSSRNSVSGHTEKNLSQKVVVSAQVFLPIIPVFLLLRFPSKRTDIPIH